MLCSLHKSACMHGQHGSLAKAVVRARSRASLSNCIGYCRRLSRDRRFYQPTPSISALDPWGIAKLKALRSGVGSNSREVEQRCTDNSSCAGWQLCYHVHRADEILSVHVLHCLASCFERVCTDRCMHIWISIGHVSYQEYVRYKDTRTIDRCFISVTSTNTCRDLL